MKIAFWVLVASAVLAIMNVGVGPYLAATTAAAGDVVITNDSISGFSGLIAALFDFSWIESLLK